LKAGQRDNETLVRFEVSDTGIGISSDRMQSIFEPFEQENRKVSQQFGGTGLGLSISQNIVRMMGGELKVESTPGKGSCFSFEVWMRRSDEILADKTAAAGTDIDFSGKRMLLVDDVDINRLVVSSMLEDTGIAIDEVDDGLAAIKCFDASLENYYDIILMDIQMPNMDGYDASMAIRALNRSDAGIVPIVALTANAFKEDIDKALEHKMNAHIAKPVELDTLMEILARFLGDQT
jgi:CheY-like chemotaxis protein